MIRVECSPWFPLLWSMANGMRPVPYDIWLCWHHAHHLPRGEA